MRNHAYYDWFANSPAYSGKHIVSGDLRIFSSKRSFLLRKRIMDVSPNHLLLHIESKSLRLSCIRFVDSSSCNTWSYSDMATQKMMAVTSSKQWIHFFRSDLCPPTSKSLDGERKKPSFFYLRRWEKKALSRRQGKLFLTSLLGNSSSPWFSHSGVCRRKEKEKTRNHKFSRHAASIY